MPFLRGALTVCYLTAIILVYIIGFTPLNVWLTSPLIEQENPLTADVIIVLGSGLKNDGQLTPSGKERVMYGARLLEQQYASSIVMSGGKFKDTPYYESVQMAEFAKSLGVPDEYIVAEKQSTSTYENAQFTKPILEENAWDDALLVTSKFHSQRACNVFTAQHIAITCTPADSSIISSVLLFDRLSGFLNIAREYAATVYYSLKGYI